MTTVVGVVAVFFEAGGGGVLVINLQKVPVFLYRLIGKRPRVILLCETLQRQQATTD